MRVASPANHKISIAVYCSSSSTASTPQAIKPIVVNGDPPTFVSAPGRRIVAVYGGKLCCGLLVERLASLKEKLEEENGCVKWETLIFQAHFHNINWSANSYFVPETGSSRYLTYGAAVSEVEVSLLTGQTTILRTDIVYDCGQSMNPAVDLGQTEGAFVQGLGFFMQEEYLTKLGRVANYKQHVKLQDPEYGHDT